MARRQQLASMHLAKPFDFASLFVYRTFPRAPSGDYTTFPKEILMSRQIALLIVLLTVPAHATPAKSPTPDVRDCVRYLLSSDSELRDLYGGRLEEALADLQSVVRHDLNGDGRAEYFLAFGMGCGSGGCRWHVLERNGASTRLLLVSEGDVAVGTRKGGGYRTLTFTFGGGMPSATEATYQYSPGGYRQTGCMHIARRQRGSRWVVVKKTPCSIEEAPGAALATPQTTRPRNPPSGPESRLMSAAQHDWTPFLTSFRAALKRRDRPTLLTLTAPEAHGDCGAVGGEGARLELFEDEQQLDFFLNIVTPGRSTYHANEPPLLIYDRDLDACLMSLKMACWRLEFIYRPHKGWLLTHFQEPCEGC